MNSCRTWKKRISDDLDGALSSPTKKRLQKHLADCEACRAYAARLERLHQCAKDIAAAEPAGPSHLQELRESLKPRLAEAARELREGGASRKSGVRRKRWPWWAVGTLAAASLLFVLVVPQGDRQGPTEVYAFSLEDALASLSAELGNDLRLEVSFNELLAATIPDAAEASDTEFLGNPFENPLFWEDLSEEELRYIESEMKKEIKS